APRGGMAAVLSTMNSKDPGRLSVGVLPNKVSRHGCPARGESIRRCVDKAGLGSRGRAGILLVLDDAAHVTAALNAVGRALPQYSGRSGKASSLKVQVFCVDATGAAIEINKLLDEGLRGIHSVGRAAVEAPRMLVATYTPESGSGKHIALVGKGITYDTGGLNLKISGNMSSMKCDMGGSAAVLGAFRVLASQGCPHTVSLIMCMAENAIGPASYKPDDIIEMHSGKMVEINNTDAEGRLLLADGVSYAARVLECDIVIDAATLTGAQLITTGKLHGAVFSNDEALEQTLVSSGYAMGDLAHAMLFVPELLQEEFRSRVADMTNSVGNRMNAQSSCAAQFVYSHLADTRAKWAQIDLAGPAFPFGRGSGYGVALLVDAVHQL
ncbi:MAG: leucyl aminopeptidase family protein, partial [Nannocystaceae bacterium]